jgi:hypothetical protein
MSGEQVGHVAAPFTPLLRRAQWCCVVVALPVLWAAGEKALAQQHPEIPPLRVTGLAPGGVRLSATDSWGQLDFELSNLSGDDRVGRVFVFFQGEPDVQFGRDVWVPAHSVLSSWMLTGPPGARHRRDAFDIEFLLYDRTDGGERLILPRGEERLRSRRLFYRKREASTSMVLDDDLEAPGFGELPRPPSRAGEALALVGAFRQALEASDHVGAVYASSLPPMAAAYDGIDHLVLASGRLTHDHAGMTALRHWLQQGGKVWVMLDMVPLKAIAPLLGDTLDFQIVDKVGLTSFKSTSAARDRLGLPPLVSEHEQPVEFVRVLLPAQERVQHTVDGWPLWFTRSVGRGKIVFTTLAARGWHLPRKDTAPVAAKKGQGGGLSPHDPARLYWGLLEDMTYELHASRNQETLPLDAFLPLLSQEIGYAVVERTNVILVFVISLAAAVVCGTALWRRGRVELLGWLGPAAALGAAGVFVGLGESSRRSVAPTVAVGQIVHPAPGTREAAVHGLLAVYRPESGPADIGARRGGFFDLDMAGSEGQSRRFTLTDIDAWHWENLTLPVGIRTAPFHGTVSTMEPVRAIARLGPLGLEGKLDRGAFRDVSDAVLSTGEGRDMAVRLSADGTFQAASTDVLPIGQFLAGAVLSDQQQRRQELFRAFLKPSADRGAVRNVLLAWAAPIDMGFSLAAEARLAGAALVVIPLEMEHSDPGERVTVPGPLVRCDRIVNGRLTRLARESPENADIHLRFQLPATVLPFKVEQARLLAKIHAPARRLSIAGRTDAGLVQLHSAESPVDPIRVDIADPRLLRLDGEGGLHIDLSLRESAEPANKRAARDLRMQNWKIEYIEVEVEGRTE